ncbi:MAG TPA: hydrogenase maturation protease [Oscillatoriaceae cyanobacterium M33_DOE_052]|uniref:Hydrogenase maturation protease n=1 Tax=Planktothricoides sp. SpSt-374 TaxID=2282167 RepID=A0A7C3VHD5_9CYAN|nr:hydrogenase maturation protease [Oscillatoriaceae cyanobacterium M33_DOE_052]
MPTWEKVVVIGYGNTLRRDDGAGQKVAEAVAARGWENVLSLAVHQLTPELAAEIATADKAIFADASPDAKTVEVREIADNFRENLPFSPHTSDPKGLLSLTKLLYDKNPKAWWVLIPALDFEFGEELSPVTVTGIIDAVAKIEQLIIA